MIPHLNRLITDLRASHRPVLLVGGGARDSQVLELSRRTGIPAYPTWNALDIVPSDFQNYCGRIGTYGGAGRNFGLQNCDLLIAIGTRISGRITGGMSETFTRGARRWLIDTEPNWNPVEIHESLAASADTFTSALLAALTWLPDWREWRSLCLDWRYRYDPVRPEFFQQETVHPYAFARKLSELADPRAVVITDCGGNVVVMNQAFETKQGQRFFSNNGNSPMGFSFCGALGAWFAAPERQVICVIGDGGMTVNSQELQTVVNYGAKFKTFILDNRVYGITKAYQRTNMGGRYEACGPVGYNPPDWERVCLGYGVDTRNIFRTQNMELVIADVLAADHAIVCVVLCPEFSTYEPRIASWSDPIEDMSPKLPREEFRANMIIDPLPGWDTRSLK
mgnify:CR=1 FL=1